MANEEPLGRMDMGETGAAAAEMGTGKVLAQQVQTVARAHVEGHDRKKRENGRDGGRAVLGILGGREVGKMEESDTGTGG